MINTFYKKTTKQKNKSAEYGGFILYMLRVYVIRLKKNKIYGII